MPGLVPGIHGLAWLHGMAGYVYIVAIRRDGVLYVDVNSNIKRRTHEHRFGHVEGFPSVTD
jgi:predicted GIY-YIG superfamily endonuclease